MVIKLNFDPEFLFGFLLTEETWSDYRKQLLPILLAALTPSLEALLLEPQTNFGIHYIHKLGSKA